MLDAIYMLINIYFWVRYIYVGLQLKKENIIYKIKNIFIKMSSVIRTHTLQAAYESRIGLKKIYAQGVPCTYIVAREKLFWDHCMSPLDPKERCFFEVIELDKPCHLYIDLDVDLVKYPMIDVHDVKDMVCGHIESVLYDKFDKENVSKIVAESSNDKKGSLPVSYTHLRAHET